MSAAKWEEEFRAAFQPYTRDAFIPSTVTAVVSEATIVDDNVVTINEEPTAPPVEAVNAAIEVVASTVEANADPSAPPVATATAVSVNWGGYLG